jgi:ATPase subunit of ABC transporter with duplicated ATPase domains
MPWPLETRELAQERAEHALTKQALELACKDLEAARRERDEARRQRDTEKARRERYEAGAQFNASQGHKFLAERDQARRDLKAAKASAERAWEQAAEYRVERDQARRELADVQERVRAVAAEVNLGVTMRWVLDQLDTIAGDVATIQAKPAPGLTGQEWAAKCKAMAEPKPRRHVYVAGGQCRVRCGLSCATVGRTPCEGRP